MALEPLLRAIESLSQQILDYNQRIEQMARDRYPEGARLQQVNVPSFTTSWRDLNGQPLGFVAGSPNESRKMDWARVSNWARASRRLTRKASARSRVSAIPRCSASGGRGT